MELVLDSLLENAGKHGLSIKQLKNKTGLSKNNIKHLLFHSKNVKDTEPYIHGSNKRKIHVYSFEPFEISYIKRKLIKKKIIDLKKKPIEPIEQFEEFEEIEEFEKLG